MRYSDTLMIDTETMPEPDSMQRIAMWSGPRNISTALLRAFENRPDTCVVDEPLYARYLLDAGHNHPGREQIISDSDTDYNRITLHLSKDEPDGCSVYYQKHMAHHLRTTDSLAWLDKLSNVFLVRDPAAMLVSLAKVLGTPSLDETGLPQQMRLVNYLMERGHAFTVIDSASILKNPEGSLRRLCAHLEIPFDAHMLHWPAGPRTSDGVWARYWYDAVCKSTEFHPYRPGKVTVPDELRPLLMECQVLYARLLEFQLDAAE